MGAAGDGDPASRTPRARLTGHPSGTYVSSAQRYLHTARNTSVNSNSVSSCLPLQQIPMKKKNVESPGVDRLPSVLRGLGMRPEAAFGPGRGLGALKSLVCAKLVSHDCPEMNRAGSPGPTHPVKRAHAQLGGQQRDGGVVGLQADTLLEHLHGAGRLGESGVFL